MNEEEFNLLNQLLDSYETLPEKIIGSDSRFVMKLLNAGISQFPMLDAKIYENSHTIGKVPLKPILAHDYPSPPT